MKNLFVLFFVICFSCGTDYTPKPHAHLRLDYPEPDYITTNLDLPFTFEKNKLAETIKTRKIKGTDDSYGIDIEYPSLKGTIYLTYKSIRSEEKLISYLRDAQNFTQKHTQKADEIAERPYGNPERKVYGMFYEVGGNAASQSQFYVTDSIKHFLTGSLYFYIKPNYDSILPAAHYLQRDIQRIMESVMWK
jgi:gliding motility-associated lipoprotein GldD